MRSTRSILPLLALSLLAVFAPHARATTPEDPQPHVEQLATAAELPFTIHHQAASVSRVYLSSNGLPGGVVVRAVDTVASDAMPGPISDSYDPEFGTGARAAVVREAITDVVTRIGQPLGPQLHNINDVVDGRPGPVRQVSLRGEAMLRHFEFHERLLEAEQHTVAAFRALAVWLVQNRRPGPERTVSLRKLLEGMDAALRAPPPGE